MAECTGNKWNFLPPAAVRGVHRIVAYKELISRLRP